jgi:hypothetical protein
MQTLPLDLVKALPLDITDLLELCQVDKTYASICRNLDFWRRKIREEYGSDIVG